MSVPAYCVVDNGDEKLWAQLSHLIRVLKWTTHDNLTLSLLPSLPTTRCVFAKSDDGSFLGAVVWNEFEEIAWVGMYVCLPEVCGRGIGSAIWKRAMERITSSGKTLGLRGVPEMAPKYAARETPLEVSRLRFNIVRCAELLTLCSKFAGEAEILLKSELSAAQLEELYDFDEHTTGRDRRDILIPFLASPSFECAVLLDENGKIKGWAGITSVGLEKERLFKLAPVYASSLSRFARLTEALMPFCESSFDRPNVAINILSGTVGERELEPLLSKTVGKELTTLFSEKIDYRLRGDLCFSAHNSCGHFDG